MKKGYTIFPGGLLVALLQLSIHSHSQDTNAINIDWMYSETALGLSATPAYHWLPDESFMVFENTGALLPGIPVHYEYKGKSKSIMVNEEDAIESIMQLPVSEELGMIPEHIGINNQGTYMLYDINNDLFILDLTKSSFIQITQSDAQEESPVFSPNGEQLAFSMNHDLYYYDIKSGKQTQLTHDGAYDILNGTLSWVYWEEIFGRTDHAIWWSPDNQKIAFFRTDERETGEYFFQDFEPASPYLYSQRYPKTGQVNPQVEVGIIDLTNGSTTWVDFGDHDFEYVIRLDWLPNSERLAIQTMNRDQTDLDLYFYDLGSGRLSHILKEQDACWVNIHEDLYFLGSGDRFIWQSERSGYAHLYLYDMNGNLLNPITQGDWSITSSNSNVSWVRKSLAYVDEKKGQVYFSARKKSSLENHLYRIDLNGSNLVPLTETLAGFHEVSFSPNGKYFLDEYSAISRPSQLRINETKKPSHDVLWSNDMMDELDVRIPEFTEIPASDGFMMPATILYPRNFNESKQYPVIFHVYGGPSSPEVQNQWAHKIFWHNILADKGFVVIAVDNRSATGISKKLENTIMGNTPTAEMSDLRDAAVWVGKQPYVDRGKMGIWGWSGGGSFTLAALTQSDLFSAGIAVAPVSDWRYYDTKFGEMIMDTPKTNLDGYLANSHVENAANLKGKLLLVHGTMDDNVHFQNSLSFANALIEAGITFDMMVYPNRDHSIVDREARIHLYRTMLEFWIRNLSN